MPAVEPNNLAESLIKAEECLKQSDYKQAYEIYLSLEKIYHNSPEIYNNLAISAHQLQKQQECFDYINQAINLDSENPSYYAQKAKFYDLDNFEAASLLYNHALSLCCKNDDRELINQIKKNHSDLLYNYATSLLKNSDSADKLNIAIELLKKAIDDDKSNYKALYNLAFCYFNIDDTKLGVDYLKQTLEINPNHTQSHFTLSQYYQSINNTEQAEKHIKKATESDSINKAEAEYNYGVLEQQKQNYEQALSHYYKCIEINNQHFAAHYNIASVNQSLGNINKAIEYYEKALKINPKDINSQYLLASLSQNNDFTNNNQASSSKEIVIPSKSPAPYIESLFDSYADDFEFDLKNNLNYKTPELLYKYYTETINNKNIKILDLGCGTGLVGDKFKNISAHLTGVDLSQNMLNQSEQKKIYDNLIKSEIIDYLKLKKSIKYDLIVLADVLVYFGDLKEVLKLCLDNLSIKGNIIFSTENLNNSNMEYRLNQTGRFSHDKDYINSISMKLNRKPVLIKQEIIRTQSHKDVHGLITIL